MRKYQMLLLTSVLLIWCTSCENQEKASESTRQKTKLTKNIISILEEKIPQWQKDLKIPNVGLGLIEEGKIIHSKVYGESTDGIPSPLNSLFNIASVTKVLVATLTMKLVNNGDWDLDAPLYHYHIDDDVKDDPRHKLLTSRHILSQQSGFVNWRWNHPTEKLTFDYEPGTVFQYSGEGMEYLRKSLENKFGKSLSVLADSLLFEPLEMEDTRHEWDGIVDADRFCKWYDTDGELYDIEDYSTIDNAADDVVTSIGDLSRFGIHVLEGAGLSNILFDEMVSTQSEINPNLQQGIGWRVVNDLPNNEYAIQHGGNDIGVAALIVLLPNSKRGIIVTTNGDNGLLMCNKIVRMALKEGAEIIHKSYRSTAIDALPIQITLDEQLLKTYEGDFVQPSGRAVNIHAKDNSLYLKMAGVPILNFLPQTQDTFFLLDFDAKLSFSKGGKGGIESALIIEGENTIVCKKVDP